MLFATQLSWAEKRQCFDISNAIHKNSHLEFIKHEKPTKFGSYLAMNVSYGPVKELYNVVQKKLGQNLKNRGEAHITVITPPEFRNQLSSHLTIQEINRIAKEHKIQQSQFENVCLGRGSIVNKNKEASTYYIVVESNDLLAIRQAIHKEYVKKGGDPNLFDPNDFYPHITLGFTNRDLHISDGVVKDKKSCAHKIASSSKPCSK